MNKKNYNVIINDTKNEFKVGRIIGICSTVLNDSKLFVEDCVKAFRDKNKKVETKEVLVVTLTTNEFKWKKIRNMIESTYPELCTFVRIYDVWFERN